jgi:hypothetical protein
MALGGAWCAAHHSRLGKTVVTATDKALFKKELRQKIDT